MSKVRFLLMLWLLAGMCFISGCAEEAQEEAALRLPPREHTWVRKERVSKSKNEFFAGNTETLPTIPVNEELKKKLTGKRASQKKGAVVDKATCLTRAIRLDNKRTAVQKAGGVWHTFERSPAVKPYTDKGMQLDSRTNKMVFALLHLCQTAKGVPMDNVARRIHTKVDAQGRGAVRRELIELGDSPVAVDRLLNYAEFSEKNTKRVVSYPTIEDLLFKAEPLIDLYGELSRRSIDETSKDVFLSDAVTLLDVISGMVTVDPVVIMALKEDTEMPMDEPEDM